MKSRRWSLAFPFLFSSRAAAGFPAGPRPAQSPAPSRWASLVSHPLISAPLSGPRPLDLRASYSLLWLHRALSLEMDLLSWGSERSFPLRPVGLGALPCAPPSTCAVHGAAPYTVTKHFPTDTRDWGGESERWGCWYRSGESTREPAVEITTCKGVCRLQGER